MTQKRVWCESESCDSHEVICDICDHREKPDFAPGPGPGLAKPMPPTAGWTPEGNPDSAINRERSEIIRVISEGLSGSVEDRGRTFTTGATRDTSDGKPEYHLYLSPRVIKRFGEYMLKHQIDSNGNRRDGDNWQKGMPLDVYLGSGFRHFMDWWTLARSNGDQDALEEALCALLFNVQGYLFELLLRRDVDEMIEKAEAQCPFL